MSDSRSNGNWVNNSYNFNGNSNGATIPLDYLTAGGTYSSPKSLSRA
ncbi:hypothetical protein [Planktothrix agardhii]|nr:hypothetical protein [Planktothrix agardhii]